MAYTLPNGREFLLAAIDAELKADKQAMCEHDWQPSAGGFGCPRCDSWTAELFCIPVAKRDS